jgi:phosphodiesterase/alkaline phosphatase D-like protein
VAVSVAVKSLTPNTTYRFRISAASATGTAKGAEATFHTSEAVAPSAETGSASEVGQRTAALAATVDPNGSEVTSCTFEYGTTTLSGSAPCSAAPGAGTSPVQVSAKLKGLTPGTTYRYRISATSLSGTSKGAVGSFGTIAAFAPTVETASASEVTKSSALLGGTVNPNGAEVTSCKFEYGTSSLSSSVACSELPGSGTATVSVSATAKGLANNTTYHFRISATSLSGTSKGVEGSFKT